MAGAGGPNYSTSRLYAENRQASSNVFLDEDPNEIAFDDYTRRKEANIGHHKPRRVLSRRRANIRSQIPMEIVGNQQDVVYQANQYRDTRLSTEVDANLWESLRYDTKRLLEMSDTSVRGLIRLQKENVDKLIDASSELEDLHFEMSIIPDLTNASLVAQQKQELARSDILGKMLSPMARQNEAADVMKGTTAILETRIKDKEVMESHRAQRSVPQGSPREMGMEVEGTAVRNTSLKKMLRMVDSKLKRIRNALREQNELIQDYLDNGCVDFPPEEMLHLIGELFAYIDHILDIPDLQIAYGVRCLPGAHTVHRDTRSPRHHLPVATGTLRQREYLQTSAMSIPSPERTVNPFAKGTRGPRGSPETGRRQEGGEEAESEKRKEGAEEAESEKQKEGGEDSGSERQPEGGEEVESDKVSS